MERNIKLLGLINFFIDLDFLGPVAIIYFERVTGSFALGMSLFSLVMISSALFEVPTGIFSDRIGRKKTLIYGSVAGLISALFLILGSTYLFLALSAIFAGLGRAFYSGNNEALLYDSLKAGGKEKQFHVYLGKLSTLFQVSLAISAGLGGMLANWSFAFVLVASAIPRLCILITSFFIIEPRKYDKSDSNIFAHFGTAFKEFVKNKKLRVISLYSVISFGLGESSFTFNSAFINTLWPLWAVGFARMLSYIAAGLSFWFSGRLINKFGSYPLLMLRNFATRSMGIIAILLQSPLSPLLMSANSLWYGIGSVAEKKLLHQEFTDNERATMGSLNALLGSICFSIFSITLGIMADAYGITLAALFAQVALLSLIGLLVYLKRMNKARI